MLVKSLQRWFYPDVAVDLGTATTRVALIRGRNGYAEPSVSGKVPALRAGVVIDIDAAAEVLKPLFHHLQGLGFIRPRVLACAPTDTTPEEREAVIDACYRAGAGLVALMPEPVAAAVGDGVDPNSTRTTLLVDIGEGVTDCALIKEGCLIETSATRIACANLRSAITRVVEERYDIALPPSDAQRIMEKLGVGTGPVDSSGMPLLSFFPVFGISSDATPRQVNIPSGLLREATRPITDQIADTIYDLTANLSSEERAEIAFNGIRISGGGSLLPGMTELVSTVTELPVRRVRHPLGAVIHGAKALLPHAINYKLWERVRQDRRTPK